MSIKAEVSPDIGMIYSSFGATWGKKCRYFKRKDRNYVDYAAISAASAKRLKPDIHITLATDDDTLTLKEYPVFDNIMLITDSNPYPFSGRTNACINTPYDRTICIDVDTKVLHARFFEVFDILKKYDIAGVAEPSRHNTNGIANGNDGNILKQYNYIPTSFVEINAGMLCYNKNDKVLDAFRLWLDRYEQDAGRDTGRKIACNDQQSLRSVLWDCDLELYILPFEYNYRERNIVQNDKKTFKNTLMHHSRFAQDYDEALEWHKNMKRQFNSC